MKKMFLSHIFSAIFISQALRAATPTGWRKIHFLCSTLGVMPAHTHTYTVANAGSHIHVLVLIRFGSDMPNQQRQAIRYVCRAW